MKVFYNGVFLMKNSICGMSQMSGLVESGYNLYKEQRLQYFNEREQWQVIILF